jgi:hypothetical protein
MKKLMKNMLAIGLILISLQINNQAQLLNGSFELGNNLSSSGGFEYNVPGTSWNAGIAGANGFLLRYYQSTLIGSGYLVPQSGSYALALGQSGDPATELTVLGQSISGLTIGQQYVLGGYASSLDNVSQTGALSISGTNVGNIGTVTGASVGAWDFFNYTFTASSASETINFVWKNDAAGIGTYSSF